MLANYFSLAALTSITSHSESLNSELVLFSMRFIFLKSYEVPPLIFWFLAVFKRIIFFLYTLLGMSVKVEIQGSECLRRTFDCKWTVKDFSKLSTQRGIRYTSEKFRLPYGEIDCFWQLGVYPNGRSASEGYVTYELEFYGLNEDINENISEQISGTLSIRKEDNLIQENRVDDFTRNSSTFFDYYNRTGLLQILTNDTLDVCAQLLYSIPVSRYDRMKRLSGDLKALMNDKETSDAVISVGGIDFPMHTLILSARSKVFSAMFQHNTTENEYHRVVITDFDEDTVKSLLQFIYTGTVDYSDVSFALDLLKAADKYDLDDLRTDCSNYLLGHLDDDNILTVLVTAHVHNVGALKQKVLQCFCEPKRKFSENDRSLMIQNPEVLFDIAEQLMKD